MASPGNTCYLLKIPFETRDQILRELMVREGQMIQPMIVKKQPSDTSGKTQMSYRYWDEKISSPPGQLITLADGQVKDVDCLTIPKIKNPHLARTPISVALLSTCHQLHDEGTKLLYGANKFRFDLHDGSLRLGIDVAEVVDIFEKAERMNRTTKELLSRTLWRFIHTIDRSNAELIQTLEYTAITTGCALFPGLGRGDSLLFRHTLLGLRTLTVVWCHPYYSARHTDHIYAVLSPMLWKHQYNHIWLDQERIIVNLVNNLPMLEEIVLFGETHPGKSNFAIKLSKIHRSATRELVERVFDDERYFEDLDQDKQELKKAFRIVLEAEVAEERVKKLQT